MTSNESIVLLLICFFCTYVRETVRPYGRTDVPKKNRDVPTNKSCSSRKIGGKKCRSRRCPTPPCRARAVRSRTYTPLTEVPKRIRDVPTNQSCPSERIHKRNFFLAAFFLASFRKRQKRHCGGAIRSTQRGGQK